ncbi:peroxide stress protein YaaA [Clostridium algidicarnis]|uniref:UPF0246 protein BD821_103144 n=2 Tax=Clostridium algidicarnis TaxID=37659 RepID=A0A2S6FZG2_9CLOT|nr:peroxide stress protein YaaA [Clostridium algidicarnis]MBB6631568.1 peroxide stress protein YaaA [Clostridium algidicarnis]MBU3218891.1 peroxide stress protein YaaA [Clostridium algidicarnis]MCB2285979.1 peroxide stress protein YaaA [Clostridium algidicarnis]PPK49015.1 hypothetical protein BD821_103144 [Clostridium algidicarnis DSM 15099]
MKVIISPAKSLEFKKHIPYETYSKPEFLNCAEYLIEELKELSKEEIGNLMNISYKLSEINFYRYKSWNKNLHEGTRQAIYAFDGDVYKGLNSYDFNKSEIDFAQNNLRILSGLYGVLRPLDLIKPYRLEMGIKLENDKGNNLYKYWEYRLTNYINNDLKEDKEKILLNLASKEYSKVLNRGYMDKDIKIISPVFKEYKNNNYKIVAIYAKKARGLMAQYIIKNKINKLEEIKEFNLEGYAFREDMSTEETIVFTRG